jgi:5,6-dimethylbenzimidazole synthase
VDYDQTFRDRLHDLCADRRDVRRFRRDALPPGKIDHLLHLATLAPSVGLSQPWRFVLVDDASRRAAIRANFLRCNQAALAAYDGEQAQLYARLKLAGLEEAPVHLAVFADHDATEGHGLGRRTMPEMIDYSVVTAILILWLTARAEGIGLGWVSILDPLEVARSLDVPAGWRLIGYLCLGYPEHEDRVPELEREGWEQRQDWRRFIHRR